MSRRGRRKKRRTIHRDRKRRRRRRQTKWGARRVGRYRRRGEGSGIHQRRGKQYCTEVLLGYNKA